MNKALRQAWGAMLLLLAIAFGAWTAWQLLSQLILPIICILALIGILRLIVRGNKLLR